MAFERHCYHSAITLTSIMTPVTRCLYCNGWHLWCLGTSNVQHLCWTARCQ